jgi:hypothetical protein
VLKREECFRRRKVLYATLGKRVLGSSLSASVNKTTRNHLQLVLPGESWATDSLYAKSGYANCSY